MPVETNYTAKITKFLEYKKPKSKAVLMGLMKLPEIALTKDIAMLTSLLQIVRQHLNLAVQLYRNIEMLQAAVEEQQNNLNYILDEKKIECLSDVAWVNKNLIPKMSKEERELKALYFNKDLYNALHLINQFKVEVDAIKRAVYSKKDDLDRVRKDIGAMIWGVRTEEFLNGRIDPVKQEDVAKFLSTNIKDMDDYLKIGERS